MNSSTPPDPDDIRRRGYRRLSQGVVFFLGGLAVGAALFLVLGLFPEVRAKPFALAFILLAACFGVAVYGAAFCFQAAGMILARSESAGVIIGIVFFLTIVPVLVARHPFFGP